MHRRLDGVGLLALVCPVVAVTATASYQAVTHRQFWRAITPAESFVGAMMGVGEVVQLVVAAAIGSLLGLALAVASIRLARGDATLGKVALTLNAGILLILIALWVRAQGQDF